MPSRKPVDVILDASTIGAGLAELGIPRDATVDEIAAGFALIRAARDFGHVAVRQWEGTWMAGIVRGEGKEAHGELHTGAIASSPALAVLDALATLPGGVEGGAS